MFGGAAYLYGEAPNDFFVEEIRIGRVQPLEGRALDLGCGEGRNAVYLAEQGFAVTAVDFAEQGLAKGRKLAERKGVADRIHWVQADVLEWDVDAAFDAVFVAFLHLPSETRPQLHRKIGALLRPGGRLFAEWFHPDQRREGYASGGPPEPEMMPTPDELDRSFFGWRILKLVHLERELNEGAQHKGLASVIQFVAEKPEPVLT